MSQVQMRRVASGEVAGSSDRAARRGRRVETGPAETRMSVAQFEAAARTSAGADLGRFGWRLDEVRWLWGDCYRIHAVHFGQVGPAALLDAVGVDPDRLRFDGGIDVRVWFFARRPAEVIPAGRVRRSYVEPAA